METSVVLFKPRIHLFACTHPSVSNSLDCNDWLVYKHQSTALCSNTFGLWFLVVFKHQSPPCVSNMSGLWIVDPCLRTRISLQPFDQTRLDCGSLLFTSIVSTLSFKHVWNVDPCLRTRISPQPCVSNAFGLWIPVCASSLLFVYPPDRTKMNVTPCGRQGHTSC